MGRRSKLTKDIRRKLLEAIEKGATQKLAAQYARIRPETLSRWITGAQEPRAPKHLVEFLEEFREAEGKLTMHCLDDLNRAAEKGSWQASAWRLERRFPNEYAPPDAARNQPDEMNEDEKFL